MDGGPGFLGVRKVGLLLVTAAESKYWEERAIYVKEQGMSANPP